MKRADKYFTKGLQAGVLATALIVGTAGCSNAAGGNEIDGGKPPVGPTTDICGLVHKDFQHPAYMYDTGDFGGQRFVESNANWFDDNQTDKNAKFTEHYDDADQYIDCKVAKLQTLLQENTGSDLFNPINAALENFNNGTSISQKIDNNYNVLAPIFAAMSDQLNDTDFNRFNVSYYKLAADAFNQSIGVYATTDSNKRQFTTNSEMIESNNFFAQEITDANLSYAEATDRSQAITRMNSYLTTIANNTETNLEVLKKVVELALYNESLYGLNDYTVQCGLRDSRLDYTQRRLNIFHIKVSKATYNISNIQSIDDRTM